uniref:Uncharacterized protein n=1 Tax=Anguilla anguilla TaxID=7936 RepID=A0A0E9UUE3_ANGAN
MLWRYMVSLGSWRNVQCGSLVRLWCNLVTVASPAFSTNPL